MTPDLFAALSYDGLENRHSVLLLSVLRHLSDDARAAVLADVAPTSPRGSCEVAAQHPSTAGMFDGWLLWPGRRLVVMEAKVDDVLPREQAERYATWLGGRDEPERILWLVTRDRVDVRDLLPTLTSPTGVGVIWTSWTALADRAFAVAEASAHDGADRLLLRGLGARLRASGLAASPAQPIDPDALALAVELFPQVVALKKLALTWLRGIPWLSGWTRETRDVTWTGLSVYGERLLPLARTGADAKERAVSWWVEVNAPVAGPDVWPKGQRHGVQLRVGVRLWHRAVAEIALEPLRAALGIPGSEAHRGYLPATPYHPAVYDAGTYHELWWRMAFDPRDLEATAARLRAAMAEQARRIAPLVQGDVATWGVTDAQGETTTPPGP